MFGFTQQASADSLLPAPSFVSGPADGSTINTDGAQFVFAYLDPITGGTLTGYLCSVDGAPDVACDSGTLDLAGLGDGLHSLVVRATVALLPGQPVCVLTICIPSGPLSVVTDLASRVFTVALGGASGGTGGTPAGGGGEQGSTAVSGTDLSALLAKYGRQKSLCLRMKHRIHRYKTHRSRMGAARRYKRCIKRQKTLRAAVMAAAR